EVHRRIAPRARRHLALLDTEPEADPDVIPADAGVRQALQQSFLQSPYADIDPVRVEAPFVVVVGDRVVRGRIDAVYERDGRVELVDFKTGLRPAEGDPSAQSQLDLYGLAAVETWNVEP